MAKKVLLPSIALLIIFFVFSPAFAQYQNQEKIPGAAQQQSEFIPYLKDIINFGFAVIGILALFMLVIGAYQYLIASGTGNVSGAKETIGSALLGLILGLTGYIILFKINPDLVNMRGITQITGSTQAGSNQTAAPGTSAGGTASPSDMSKVKCDAVRNYNGFMNKNFSDGLGNETNIKSAQDLKNVLTGLRPTGNGLTQYSDIIYQACKDNNVPYWYAIGTFAHESNMFNEYRRDGTKYGCSAFNNPGCIHDPKTDKPQQYSDPATGIKENIALMGRLIQKNPTPIQAWNKWYWPDRSAANCAGSQSYLNKFDWAAKATGVSGI